MKRNMIFKNMLVAVAFLATGALFTACSDWDDHYDAGSAVEGSATSTIWENITSNSNLSQFADLLKKAGYDAVLNTSQSFTVWAPLNGTFDYDALTTVGNDKLLKEFVQNHIARNNIPASGSISERIYMLNKKVHNFEGAGSYTMSGVPVAQANVPSVNGVIHTLNGKLLFQPNIFESLEPGDFPIDSISAYIHAFDIKRLDKAKSIQGPVVDGQITYLDSVFEDYNTLVEGLGINTEDSNYTMIVPTNEAWTRAMKNISSYYNYIDKFTYIESPARSSSLQHIEEVELPKGAAYWKDSLSHSVLLRGLFYNNNEYDNVKLNNHQTGQKLGADSLITASYNLMYSEDAEALFTGTTRVDKSNGDIYITDDSLRMHPWTIWNPLINIETEYSSYLGSVSGGSASPVNNVIAGRQNPAVAGRLSNYGYLEAYAASNQQNPELNFYLRNVRSTTYVIYGVIVPSNITNVYETNPKGNSFRVSVGYNNEKGAMPTNPARLGDFESDPTKIDTIRFGEVTFPICYYGTGYSPFLRIEGRVSANSDKYDRTIRIDRIFLVPKELDDYLKEHPDYKFDDPFYTQSSGRGTTIIIIRD